MFIIPFCPANVFQSDKMVVQTYIQEDRPRGNRSGLYEFFRGKAWVCGHALVGMAKVNSLVTETTHTRLYVAPVGKLIGTTFTLLCLPQAIYKLFVTSYC